MTVCCTARQQPEIGRSCLTSSLLGQEQALGVAAGSKHAEGGAQHRAHGRGQSSHNRRLAASTANVTWARIAITTTGYWDDAVSLSAAQALDVAIRSGQFMVRAWVLNLSCLAAFHILKKQPLDLQSCLKFICRPSVTWQLYAVMAHMRLSC